MAKKKAAKKKTARRPRIPQVDRRIQFYRISFGQTPAGVPVHLDLGPLLQQINALAFAENARYVAGPDGTSLCCWPDRRDAMPYRFRIGVIRRGGLPRLENAGALSDLTIPQDAGLVELTHCVSFEHGIVGAVFNFYGPRPSRFASYLNSRAQLPQPAEMEALLHQDVHRRFARLNNLKLLDLKVRPAFIETLEEADQDLGSAFAAAREAGGAEHVQIVLRSGRARREHLADRVLGFVRTLLHRDDLQENAERFVVKGFDRDAERVEELDLLNDKLVTKKSIIRQNGRSRALNDASAYEAVEEAFNELRDELLQAAGVVA